MSEAACTVVLNGPNAGDTFTLTLKSPFAGSLKLNGVAYSKLLSVGKAVRQSLEESKIGTRDLREPSAESMYEALEEINEAGWICLSALVSDEEFPAQPERLRQFLSNVLLGARPRTATPVLKFESPLDLPIDLMPALQPSRDASFHRNNRSALYVQACDWFIGLRFVVQRFRRGGEDKGADVIHSCPFSNGRRIVLAPYRHRGLAGMSQVRSELTELRCFEILKPLPDDSVIPLRDSRAAARLITQGREPPGPEGIVHITSHCDARDDRSPLNHALLLAGGGPLGRHELRVTAKSLKSRGAKIASHGPIAVITACGAADVSYDSPISIPEALLYAGFRSVVCPLVSVHVDPGYAVTLFLYAAMKSGMSLGEALVEARKQLLEKHGHTLGLLHVCYGDTRLRFDDQLVTLPISRTRIGG